MKRVILIIAIISVILCSFATAPEIDARVLDAFNKTFPGVEGVSWSSTTQLYEANFKLNEIATRVTYNKQGNAVQTLRYYSGMQLPILVLTKVKSKFADKKIFGVTEVTSGDETTYHIILEGEKDWIHIIANSSGNTEVTERFKKA